MEGHLTYTIDGNERKMFFGNYALEQTLRDMDCSISDLGDTPEKKGVLTSRTLEMVRTFMFHATAYPILKEGGKPDFALFDMHEWIDGCGGPNGDLVQVVSKKMFEVLGLVSEDSKQKKSKAEK